MDKLNLERRSSKAEQELNAEAGSLSRTNTHAYGLFQTDEHLTYKHTHRIYLPDKIYLACISYFLLHINTVDASERIASIVLDSVKQEDR